MREDGRRRCKEKGRRRCEEEGRRDDLVIHRLNTHQNQVLCKKKSHLLITLNYLFNDRLQLLIYLCTDMYHLLT